MRKKQYTRIGFFYITGSIMSDPFSYSGLFKNIIVVNVEHEYISGQIKYFAACEDFDEVPEGELIPQYVAKFENGSTSPEWERVK